MSNTKILAVLAVATVFFELLLSVATSTATTQYRQSYAACPSAVCYVGHTGQVFVNRSITGYAGVSGSAAEGFTGSNGSS